MIQSKKMSSRNGVIVLLLLFYLINNGMAKRTAGLIIFRRVNSQIEYLMLKPTNDRKVWSPPKGSLITWKFIDTFEFNKKLIKIKSFEYIIYTNLGRVEKGEDDFLTALREAEEEVGYTVDDLDIHRNHQMIVNSTTKHGKKKVAIYWPAELKIDNKNPTLSSEHSEYRWVNKDEASSLYGNESIPIFTQCESQFQ